MALSIAMLACGVVLTAMPARAAIKTWSGVIQYATYAQAGGQTLQPYDPKNPRNGMFSFAVDVSNYDDGRYTFSFKTDALTVVPVIPQPAMRADMLVGGLTVLGGIANASNNWRDTGCIHKDANWLKVYPVNYFNFQRDVDVKIEILQHLTSRCDQGS